MWLTIEKLIALPCAKRRVCLISETNLARKINRHHHPNSVRARGSKFHMGQEITGAVITAHNDYLMLPVVYCTAGIIITSI